MNAIDKYLGRKPSLIDRIRERIRAKRYPAVVPLHPIGYRPPVYPSNWKGGNV